MKTFSPKPADVDRKWYVLDASELTLGRLSTKISELLMGKGKPKFAHHIDMGDHVIVINSDKLVVTGGKEEKKIYYRHSGYPGGIKESSLKFELEKDSRKIIEKAVRGMLPVNKLRPNRLARLKIYKTGEHSHAAQKPELLKISRENKK